MNVHDENLDREGAGTGPEALRRERDRLRDKLDACLQDLEQARRELARAREIQESLSEQLHARASGRDDTASAGEPSGRESGQSVGWWRRMRMTTEQRTMLEELELVRGSKWFDAEWYVTEYPDVANAGIDPAEHYLRHGAPEGRDPGPQFSTEAYLRKHPDLYVSGANPLLHFLRSSSGHAADV